MNVSWIFSLPSSFDLETLSRIPSLSAVQQTGKQNTLCEAYPSPLGAFDLISARVFDYRQRSPAPVPEFICDTAHISEIVKDIPDLGLDNSVNLPLTNLSGRNQQPSRSP